MAGYGATRNTCFAIISAIEDDFRSLISATTESLNSSDDILPSDVRETAHKRRLSDLRMDSISTSVLDTDLLPYIDFADISKVIESKLSPNLERERDWLNESAKSLLKLTPTRNRVCHTRPLEADDLPQTIDFANHLTKPGSPFQFSSLSNVMVRLNENPSFVLTLQIPLFWVTSNPRIHNNLPLPEFDETGFLGRKADRMQVLQLLNSHYPVVTIVGEGGIGKTALALRCLYDLLDTQTTEYDAIVWVSMKTAALTQTGVRELTGAIKTTLGLLSEIANQLGVPIDINKSEADLIDEIAEYLKIYKIIIAIDNLETISTGALRNLLMRVPSKSKILLTSRIGVGEFEVRYPLQGLDEKTSVSLIRNFSRLLNVKDIYRLDDGNIKGYCRRLYNNPLLIKWFVACVGRGADPARILSPDGTNFPAALSFCFNNLFNRFGEPEKIVINCLVSARKPLSIAELHFISPSLSAMDAEIALSALHNSSVVSRAKGFGDTLEYSLSESAANFLSLITPPSADFFKSIQSKMRELRTIITHEAKREARYEYDAYFVRIGINRDEMISAAYLRTSLDALRENQYEEARNSVDEAKRLAPNSSEVWRISALIEQAAGETYQAVENYEQSIGLDQKSRIARYCYGMFLMSDMEDLEGALIQFNEIELLDENEPIVQTAKALTLVRLARLEEAAKIHEKLLPSIKNRDRRWRITGADQAADCFCRLIYINWGKKEFDDAKNNAKRALNIILDAAERADLDDKLMQRVTKVLNDSLSKKELINDLVFVDYMVTNAERISDINLGASVSINLETKSLLSNESYSIYLKRLLALDRSAVNRKVLAESISDNSNEEFVEKRLNGKIHNVTEDSSFGFIEDASAERWFFHFKFCLCDAKLLKPGTLVNFKIGYNIKGRCAIDVLMA